MSWYELKDPERVDSPALMVYPERIKRNISEMLRLVGTPKRLVPHIKTHKMAEVVKLQMAVGIKRFKCATIAEAELLSECDVDEVILAYQLNESKAKRFLELVQKYPHIRFVSLIDNLQSTAILQALFLQEGLTANVFIDVDNGMHRTGFPIDQDLFSFYKKIQHYSHVHCYGLHVYDGHLHIQNFEERKQKAEEAFLPIKKISDQIIAAGYPKPVILAGGSPTFTIHALNPEVICSPGTCLLWDKGYGDLLPEQDFLPAAVLLTRIISKPQSGILTMDLGHKSVAAENPIHRRIFFLNLDSYKVIAQSEEHLVVEVGQKTWQSYQVGAIFYGIPQHICPTVALYDEVQVVDNNDVIDQWQVRARKKRINI